MTAILNASGSPVVSYTYDAWGKPLTITGSLATTLGTHNPLRYRGYVYDTETELYYLQSRYYNPDTGRFLNADAFTSTGQGFTGNNMFAYCGNNPIARKDDGGAFWFELLATGAIVGGILEHSMLCVLVVIFWKVQLKEQLQAFAVLHWVWRFQMLPPHLQLALLEVLPLILQHNQQHNISKQGLWISEKLTTVELSVLACKHEWGHPFQP